MGKLLKIKIFFFLLAVFVLSTNAVWGGTATVTWNANSESDLSGYKIYYGTSSRTGVDPKVCGFCGYSNSVDVGLVTSYLFNNLTNGQTYYFSVTAKDTSNNESSFSSQVSKYISVSGDLNSDSRVNSVDFGIMMSHWNLTTKPVSDLNQDGFVNSVDFGIILSQWTG
ncbi:MAG: fibronectin type III domain-containing protein [Candidatus Omnitrophica bacterium]|nr:fibronectin type III domain-containing protein [Candidatus Omnitrophota bacterium]